MREHTRRAFEQAEDDLVEQYNNGFLDNHEFNVEMRELGREYAEEAEMAAEEAYWAEREQW